MKPIPLTQLLDGGWPDIRPMALREGRILDHATWRADVSANAARIAEAGIRRALLITDDSYWFVVGLFALAQAGAVAILPPNSRIGGFQTLGGAFERVVTDRSDLGDFAPLQLASGEPSHKLSTLDADFPCMEFFTSGSTGAPKRIEKSLGQLEREIAVLENAWGQDLEDAKVLSTVPHQHIFGLTFGVLWPMMAGRRFGATIYPFWESLLDHLHPPAAVITSPAHLTRLGGLEPLEPPRQPALVFTAGAPLSFEAAQDTNRIFGKLPVEIFGSTETGAIATRRQTGEDTPWKSLPGVTVSASDANLLTVRSPYLAGIEPLVTADRVEIASDGFHFLGRSDAVVKIEGKRISLIQVESDLADLPWIEEASVAIVEDRRPLVGAVCRLSALGRKRREELGDFRFGRLLRRDLQRTQDSAALPRRWLFVETLPVDGMGKKSRPLMAQLLAGQQGGAKTQGGRRHEPVVEASRSRESLVELDLIVPSDLFYFEGHFPGHPILPGVVQIDWALRLARQHLPLPSSLTQDFQVKFRRPILPGAKVVLALRYDAKRNAVEFGYSGEGEKLSSGLIALAPR